MKQLTQNLRTGEILVEDVPEPVRLEDFVLVATRASLISAGTERDTVQAAQASLLGKARQRPDKVQQVLDNIRKEGLMATVRKVKEKLDQPKPLGYSSAGVVLEAGPEMPFKTGDRVACGGGEYAVHGEVVVVPRNLVAPLPENVSFEEGAFATVGSIALQGIRRAEIQQGCRVLVIGLGLLGHLTWQLLQDAGCIPIGTDISAGAVQKARALGLKYAFLRGAEDVEGVCSALTGGQGVDAVIITAAAHSKDPIELAGEACRERGRVVIVGAVPIIVPRETYYHKELDLVISRSYGPGRYDALYEEGGEDYPYGYVRWTEGRNIAAVVEAVARGTLKVAPLITHRFPIERASEAYDIVSGKKEEPHIGIVLTYPETPDRKTGVTLRETPAVPTTGKIRVGFVGAGSFARTYLLPQLANQKNLELVSVVTKEGYTANDAARKFGFAQASSDGLGLIQGNTIDAVFVATRHDQHGPFSQAALAAGKHVFVEKPLAVSPDHLASLLQVAEAAKKVIQVGFNRRFSPLSVALRQVLQGSAQPIQITYRVNAGTLPKEHWLLDPKQGGGRIVGEGCHFIDLMQYLTGGNPVRVSAAKFGEDADGATTAWIEFSNGSVGVLVYQGNGGSRLPKERVEAFSGGSGGIIDDWRSVELHQAGKVKTIKASGQAKGYAEEVTAFFSAVSSGKPAISLKSLALTTAATFAILEAITRRTTIDVVLPTSGP